MKQKLGIKSWITHSGQKHGQVFDENRNNPIARFSEKETQDEHIVRGRGFFVRYPGGVDNTFNSHPPIEPISLYYIHAVDWNTNGITEYINLCGRPTPSFTSDTTSSLQYLIDNNELAHVSIENGKDKMEEIVTQTLNKNGKQSPFKPPAMPDFTP